MTDSKSDLIRGPGAETVDLVHEDAATRETLRTWLRAAGLQARDFPSALTYLKQGASPSAGGGACVVVDLDMQATSAAEFIKALRDDPLSPIVIALGADSARQCREALRSGAFDYLAHPVEPAPFVDRVRRALDVQQSLCQKRRDTLEFAHRVDQLTDRERFVMRRLARGQKVKQIARDMGIGFQTVSKHGIRALEKLRVKNDIDLAMKLHQVDSLRGERALLCQEGDEPPHATIQRSG